MAGDDVARILHAEAPLYRGFEQITKLRGHRQKRAQGSRMIRLPFQMGGSAPFPSSDNNILSAGQPNLNTKAQPGFNTNKGYTLSPDSGVGGMYANPIPIDSYKTCSTAPKF